MSDMGIDVFKVDGFVTEELPISYGFFGRQGGVSTGIYSSLNCGPGSDDNPAHVKENRRLVSEEIGCAHQNLLSLHQVHGNDCVVAEAAYDHSSRPQVDAHVTDQPGLALGVLTADCTPILFHGAKGDGSSVIGAAHAGWGGALKSVSKSTVKAMEGLGAIRETIVAAIGPCISQESYEVSDEFIEPFLQEDKKNEQFFIESKKNGHLMFDLAGYNAFKLYQLGIRKVLVKSLDTYFNEEDFFSYRRTTHRREKDYGRQISVIKIDQ